MPKTTICLWFDDQAEEAAQFYTDLFPRSAVTEVSRYGEAGPGTPGTAVTVAFHLDGTPFVGLNGGPQFRFTEAISFQIHCADQAEVDHYWYAFVDGGQEGSCSWIKDRFGLSWQVVPRRLGELLSDPDPDVARRATEAMLTMGRIDVAALEAAAAG